MSPKNCCVCGKKITKDRLLCIFCSAVQFCSTTCERTASRDLSQHGHATWCSKMKDYMAEEVALAALPFTFANVTTSPEFTTKAYADFLRKTGVYGCGFWRHEANYWMNCGDGQLTFGELPPDDSGYVLPVESLVLDEDFDVTATDITDWHSYYCARGFRLDSPISIVLQYVMTLYHTWARCLPDDFATSAKDVITIGILGVEKECEMIATFFELSRLKPSWNIGIHMFGPEISVKMDGHVTRFNKLAITGHRTLFHKHGSCKAFDFVLGFNAGVGAYVSWNDTLKCLKLHRIPAYFTDYCRYSCEVSREAVEGLGVGTTSTPQVNPFRSPVLHYSRDHNMPTYSNGFLFHLVYSDT